MDADCDEKSRQLLEQYGEAMRKCDETVNSFIDDQCIKVVSCHVCGQFHGRNDDTYIAVLGDIVHGGKHLVQNLYERELVNVYICCDTAKCIGRLLHGTRAFPQQEGSIKLVC